MQFLWQRCGQFVAILHPLVCSMLSSFLRQVRSFCYLPFEVNGSANILVYPWCCAATVLVFFHSSTSGGYRKRGRFLTDVTAQDLSEDLFSWSSVYRDWLYCAGLAFPPLYFHTGGVREFLSTLRNHALLVR